MTLIRRLSLATTLSTIAVIGVGALVRATGSGDGCPDWPRCFGKWIPPFTKEALIEYSHRTAGAVAIGLLCVTAVVALVRHRADRRLVVPLLFAVPAILMQAVLGAIVVVVKGRPALGWLEPWLVTFHIATAMALLAVLVRVTVNAFSAGREDDRWVDPRIARMSVFAAGAVYLQILVGALVRGEHAGLVFPDFPLMDGSVLPSLTSGRAVAMFIHRLLAVIVAAIVIRFAVLARRSDRTFSTFATTAAVLTGAQIIVGGAQVWTSLAVAPVVAHVVLAALIWASLVAATGVARNMRLGTLPRAELVVTEKAAVLSRVKAYIALTKPRIILLLLITTLPTMVLAERGLPSVWLMFATVFGGTLGAGAANAINMVVDRDIDAVMARTRRRPLPRHAIGPRAALVFAILLAVASFVFMTAAVNLLAAVLTQAAIAFYVFVYTMGLKRSTPQNIVVGGAAGAVPVLVGWAAVTGEVGWTAVLLFAVVFFWTPPHFWALAMRFSDDYAAAGVPMMPVIAGRDETVKQIVLYSLGTVAVTIALWPVAQMGAIYLAAASGLGAWLLRAAMVLRRDGTSAAAMGMFRFSINYLALLFAAVGVDTLLPLGT